MRNEVTIYDIAKVLNLSASTISRALSGSTVVHKKTRLKIEQVAGELGYRRNTVANPMRAQRNRLLSAMVTQLNTTLASCVVAGAEVAARQSLYNVIINQSLNNPEVRTSNLEILRNLNFDGVLVTSAYFQEHDWLNDLRMVGIPLVVVEASSLLPGHPRKQIGDFDNAFQLTNHLIEKGCREIAYLSVDLEKTRLSNLLSGYREALRQSGLPEGDKCVFNSNDSNSWTDMWSILISMSPRPDGIIISSKTITAIAFAPSGVSTSANEFWITCRKGRLAGQNQTLVELGKLAAGLLICLSERSTMSKSNLVNIAASA